MERRRLGPTGASVGVLGLGTATWGRGTDGQEAAEQVRMLLDAGGNLIDIDAGITDQGIAARVLADPVMRREAFVSIRLPAVTSSGGLLDRLDQSIDQLGIGHADMWSIEGWDASLPWEELVSVLAVAVATGRSRYIGMCPSEPWQAAIVGAGLSMHPDRAPLAAVTIPYSLLDRSTAAQTVDAAGALGSGVLAAWPLAGGVLTGKYRHATPPDSRGASERHAEKLHTYRSAWARPVVDGLCAAAEGLGTTPGALALAWVRESPGIVSALVGARTVHQWRAALSSIQVTIPSEIRQALDEVADVAEAVGHDGGTTSGHD